MVDSRSDLIQLELAFQRDPSSDAFLELADAYRQDKRFMEAMVVCKKGIRSRDGSPEGTLVLARIFADQNKFEKVEKELKALEGLNDFVVPVLELRFAIAEKRKDQEGMQQILQELLAEDSSHPIVKSAKEIKKKAPVSEPGIENEAILKDASSMEEATQWSSAPPSHEASDVRERQRPLGEGDFSAQKNAKVLSATGSPTKNIPGSQVVADQNQNASPGASFEQEPKREISEHRFLYTSPSKGKNRSAFGSFVLFAVLIALTLGGFGYMKYQSDREKKFQHYFREAKTDYVKNTTLSLKDAAEKYEEALTIDEEHPESLARLAWIYDVLVFDRGVEDLKSKARTFTKRAKEHAAGLGPTQALEMRELTRQGEAPKAVELGSSWIESSGKTSAGVESAYLQALWKKGDYETLRARLAKSGEISHPMVLWRAARIHRLMGEEEKAKTLINRALKTEPRHVMVLIESALNAINDDARRDMATLLRDSAKIADFGDAQLGRVESGLWKITRAAIQEAQGDSGAMDKELKSAEEKLSANNSDFQYFQALRLKHLGKNTDAIKVFEKLTRNNPRRKRSWIELGSLLLGEDQHNEVKQLAQKGKQYFESGVSFETLLLSSKLKEMVSKFRKEKDMEAFETQVRGFQSEIAVLLKQLPDEASYKIQEGRALVFAKKFDEAVNTLTIASEWADASKDKSKIREASYWLGRALLRVQDEEGNSTRTDDAKRALAKAVSVGLSSSKVGYWYAKALEASGAKREARKEYRRVIDLGLDPKYVQRAKKAL